MKYNFDTIVDRSNNFAAKWSEMDKKYGTNDLLPRYTDIQLDQILIMNQ